MLSIWTAAPSMKLINDTSPAWMLHLLAIYLDMCPCVIVRDDVCACHFQLIIPRFRVPRAGRRLGVTWCATSGLGLSDVQMHSLTTSAHMAIGRYGYGFQQVPVFISETAGFLCVRLCICRKWLPCDMFAVARQFADTRQDFKRMLKMHWTQLPK